jgi:hypothetical protein
MRMKLRDKFYAIIVFIVLNNGTLFAFSSVPQENIYSFNEDTHIILKLRDRLSIISEYIETQVADNSVGLNRDEKLDLWESWASWLDIFNTLDTYGQIYDNYFKSIKRMPHKTRAFNLSYHVFLIEYRHALDLITLIEPNSGVATILNDAVPEFGLSKGSYSSFKDRYLSVIRAAELVRLGVIYNAYSSEEDDDHDAYEWVEGYEIALLSYGQTDGIVYTLSNAVDIVEDSALTAWYPVKKELLALSSKVKVWRSSSTLISLEQLSVVKEQLEPGDLLFQKREWQISNVGIPGFWTHSAIYIGSPEERVLYFSDVENDLISNSKDINLNGVEVIESIEPGVVLNTFHYSAKADSLLVLRPILSKRKKARAIANALTYLGRPYDYDFNFDTDSAIVCSELICKAFEPVLFEDGETFPRAVVFGDEMTSPNDIVSYYSMSEGEENLLEFVLFLDGQEDDEVAVFSTEEESKRSWERPKWHVLGW